MYEIKRRFPLEEYINACENNLDFDIVFFSVFHRR